MQPIIKWTGSKRSQSPAIVSLFPVEIDTYYEPFVGSGAVLAELMYRVWLGEKECGRFICSDINADLIGTWNLIKDNPAYLLETYTERYEVFSRLGIGDKKAYYKNVVTEMNGMRHGIGEDTPKDVLDKYFSMFFWTRRTCFNGLVRYNRKGDFNAPCHFTRDGITPGKLEELLAEWTRLIGLYDVTFLCHGYKDVNAGDGDVLYLDPPYANTGTSMYSGTEFDNVEFYKWLGTQPSWFMSYDGMTEEKDHTQRLEDFVEYDEHIYLQSGKSSFNKLANLKDVSVKESIYIKRTNKQ